MLKYCQIMGLELESSWFSLLITAKDFEILSLVLLNESLQI